MGVGHSIAQVPHLFGGNKFVSLGISELLFEGHELTDKRGLRNAAYCVLDSRNRVIGLTSEMR